MLAVGSLSVILNVKLSTASAIIFAVSQKFEDVANTSSLVNQPFLRSKLTSEPNSNTNLVKRPRWDQKVKIKARNATHHPLNKIATP